MQRCIIGDLTAKGLTGATSILDNRTGYWLAIPRLTSSFPVAATANVWKRTNTRTGPGVAKVASLWVASTTSPVDWGLRTPVASLERTFSIKVGKVSHEVVPPRRRDIHQATMMRHHQLTSFLIGVIQWITILVKENNLAVVCRRESNNGKRRRKEEESRDVHTRVKIVLSDEADCVMIELCFSALRHNRA